MPVSAAIAGATVLGVAGTVATFAGATTLALVFSLASYGLSAYAKVQLAERSRRNGETLGGTQEPLPVIYGTREVGGRVVDVRVNENADTDRKILDYVVAFAVGPEESGGINGVTDVWLDDTLAIDGADTTDGTYLLEGDKSSASSSHDDAGTSSGVESDFVLDEKDTGSDLSSIQYNLYTGTDTQGVNTWLNHHYSSIWDGDSDLQGIAYLHLSIHHSDDIYSGIPDVRLRVEGNPVLDTRDDTVKFTNNPILCARDYATSDRYGMGIDASRIDDSTTDSEANFCENTSPSEVTTSKRFACNAIVETGRDLRSNMTEIMSSCRGDFLYDQGTFRFNIPRSKTAESYTITEDDVVDGYTWKRKGTRDTPNIIRASYPSEDHNYQVRDAVYPEPSSTNTALTEEDAGFYNEQSIDLPYTTQNEIAHRIATILFKESREDVVVSFRGTPELLRFTIGDVVEHTHEGPQFTSKKFWVSSLGLNPDGTVTISLREYADSAYNLESTTDTALPGADLPDSNKIGTPGSFSASSGSASAITLPGGEKAPRVSLTWNDPSPDAHLNYYELQWKESSATAWDPLGRAGSTDNQFITPPVADGTDLDFRIRAVTSSLAHSSWNSISNHTPTITGNQTPVILADHDQLDNDGDGAVDTGELSADIIDPAGDTLSYDFYIKSGRGSSWGTASSSGSGVSSGSTVTETVTLSEKVNSYIKLVVTSDDSGNTAQVVRTFDPDEVPEFSNFSVNINDDGTVTAFVRGDADVNSIEFTFSGGISEGPVSSDTNSYTYTTTASLSVGDSVTVDATVYSETATSGTSKSDSQSVERPGVNTSNAAPRVDLSRGSQTNTDQSYDLYAESGPAGDSGGLEYKWRATNSPTSSENTFDHNNDGNDDWTSITDGSTVTDAFTADRPGSQPSLVIVVVRDTNTTGTPETQAVLELPQQNKGLDDSSGGQVDDGEPTNSGGGIFIKSAPSDADDATSIPLPGSGDVDSELDVATQNRLYTDAKKEQTLT